MEIMREARVCPQPDRLIEEYSKAVNFHPQAGVSYHHRRKTDAQWRDFR